MLWTSLWKLVWGVALAHHFALLQFLHFVWLWYSHFPSWCRRFYTFELWLWKGDARFKGFLCIVLWKCVLLNTHLCCRVWSSFCVALKFELVLIWSSLVVDIWCGRRLNPHSLLVLRILSLGSICMIRASAICLPIVDFWHLSNLN